MSLDFNRIQLRRIARFLIFSLLVSSLSVFAQDDPKKEKEKEKRKREQEKAGRKETLNSVYKKWLNEDVLYIITDEERKTFQALKTDDEREQFIEQFWLRRDPDPDTDVNEYREEYYQRIAYANENFASGIPGWKTDRGRIYIMFGKPDEKESHPSGGSYDRPVYEGGGTTSTYPFEIWWYRYIEGVGSDVEIEFVDPSGSGEYRIARDANEKDALLYVPNAGLTLSEELGLSSKADRIAGYSSNQNSQQLFGQRAKDQPFEKLALLANLQRAPKVKFKDLETTLGTSENPLINVDVLSTGLAINFTRVTDSAVMTSFTLQLDNSDLVYKSKGGIQEAAANIHARVTNVSGRRAGLFEDVVTSSYLPEQLEAGQKSKSVYQKDMILPPGTYKIDLVVRDVNSGRTDIKHVGFKVPDYSKEDSITSSTMILASKLESLDGRLATGPFVRGQLKVIPNATAEFKQDQTMGVYMQVYNVSIDQATLRPSVDIEYVITVSGKDKEIVKIKEDGKSGLSALNSQQITLARLIPLKQLQPGSYDIAVKVTDNVAQKSFTRKEAFTVIKNS